MAELLWEIVQVSGKRNYEFDLKNTDFYRPNYILVSYRVGSSGSLCNTLSRGHDDPLFLCPWTTKYSFLSHMIHNVTNSPHMMGMIGHYDPLKLQRAQLLLCGLSQALSMFVNIGCDN